MQWHWYHACIKSDHPNVMICPDTPEFHPVNGGEDTFIDALLNQQTEQETEKLRSSFLNYFPLHEIHLQDDGCKITKEGNIRKFR